MSRIDYSKWDHVDRDTSEDEGRPQGMKNNAAKRAKNTQAQLQSDQIVPTGEVQCIRAYCRCDYNKRCKSKGFDLFETTTMKLDHPVFNVGSLSPVSDRIGLPLQLYLESPLQDPLGHPDRGHYDNQLVTYLMIEPESGFAPPCFQAGIGTVVIARKDRKALLPEHLEVLWQFITDLLDRYGDEDVDPEVDITRAAFEQFYKRYETAQSWRDVPSPYAD